MNTTIWQSVHLQNEHHNMTERSCAKQAPKHGRVFLQKHEHRSITECSYAKLAPQHDRVFTCKMSTTAWQSVHVQNEHHSMTVFTNKMSTTTWQSVHVQNEHHTMTECPCTKWAPQHDRVFMYKMSTAAWRGVYVQNKKQHDRVFMSTALCSDTATVSQPSGSVINVCMYSLLLSRITDVPF